MQLQLLNHLNNLYACGTIRGISPQHKEQKLKGHEPST